MFGADRSQIVDEEFLRDSPRKGSLRSNAERDQTRPEATTSEFHIPHPVSHASQKRSAVVLPSVVEAVPVLPCSSFPSRHAVSPAAENVVIACSAIQHSRPHRADSGRTIHGVPRPDRDRNSHDLVAIAEKSSRHGVPGHDTSSTAAVVAAAADWKDGCRQKDHLEPEPACHRRRGSLSGGHGCAACIPAAGRNQHIRVSI